MLRASITTGLLVLLLVTGCDGNLVPVNTEGAGPDTPRAALPASQRAATPQDGPKDVMTELLHWAVQHSDPERVKELMQKYQEKNLTIADVYGKEVVDALFADEADIMMKLVVTVADFRNASLPDDELVQALTRLQDLVEQIDNGGNLHKMGGLFPLLDLGLGQERSLKIRTLALWTLGVAVQNNPLVQGDLEGLQALPLLAQSLQGCSDSGSAGNEEVAKFCSKLLYAISGLIKNSQSFQAQASELGILDWLASVGLRHSSSSLAKKSMALLDTVLAQSPEVAFVDTLPARRDALASTLVSHVDGAALDTGDTDMAEKALELAYRLILVRPDLFPSSLGQAFSSAIESAVRRCQGALGVGDNACRELQHLGRQVEALLVPPPYGAKEL